MTKEDDVNKAVEEGPGKALMGRKGIIVVAGYLIVMLVLVLYSLTAFWPPSRPREIRDELTKAAEEKRQAARAEAERKAKESETPKPQTTSASFPQTPGGTNGETSSVQTAEQVTTPTATPPPGNTPTQGTAATTAKEPDSDNPLVIKEGFCLDENGKPRVGVGAASFLTRNFCMYDEERLLLIVLLCGALGALVHGLRSFSWYVGNRDAVWSWSVRYAVLPFLGASLSFVFYLVIRGGFFSPSSTALESASPFGFAATAALIGMFSESAVTKLRKVALTIFEPPDKGKDQVDTAPKITSISPDHGKTKGGERVRLRGTNFVGAVKVTFGAATARVLSSSKTSVVVEAPPHAAGKVDVVITNGDGQEHTDKEAFEYMEPQPPDKPEDGQG